MSTTRTRKVVKAALQPVVDLLGTTSSAYVDLKCQLNDMARDLIDFSQPPSGDADSRLLRFVGLIRPWDCPTPGLARFGHDGDGGYLMWGGETPSWAVSLGVGTDVSWDSDVAHAGGRVALFDPTVRRLPQPVPNSRFHRIGIGRPADGSFAPLSDLMAMSDLPRTGTGWLKVDVEGAEWETLGPPDAEPLTAFSQMVLELHGLSQLADEAAGGKILAVMQTLAHDHRVVHVHANNYSRVSRFDSYWFPDAVEVTMLRGDVMSDWKPAQSMDHHLDAPCDPRVTDIDLQGILAVEPA